MTGLRVIAGKVRGRKLRSVPGDTTRPITDRVKESLFDILGADIQDARMLDLFAGTGSVGIEALSRGAQFVRFVERDRQAAEIVRDNLAVTGFLPHSEIIRMDSFTMLGQSNEQPFDYVFIAPPQYKELWRRALLSLDIHPAWLTDDSWVIVQIHPKEYESLELKNLGEFDQRKYGSTLLVFYRHQIDQHDEKEQSG